MIHIYSGILLSHKNEIMPFAAIWMDLELIILSAVRKREKQISYHSYVESKKMIQLNLFIKQTQTHRHKKTNLLLPKGKTGGGIN